MTTDRELLEAAARAAGMEEDTRYPGCYYSDFGDPWDPLRNDRDALRLAIALRMDVFVRFEWAEAVAPMGPAIKEPNGTDPYAATRRAIVRAAAAAIGGAK